MSWSPTERIAHLALSTMGAGELTLVGRDGTRKHFAGAEPGPSAVVELRSPAAARRVVLGNAMGLAEGYMSGEWDTPDLDAVLGLGVANLPEVPKSKTNLRTPGARAWHRMRDNTDSGSRENVRHHYDLGNDFYRLWLDETMTYSAALYTGHEVVLEEAQRRKWDRMLDLLQPSSSDHILEIGCGWGGFAMHAARLSGCRVTGITLSDEQHAWATEAVERAGLEDRVDIRLQDYRSVQGEFNGIASIEMLEAVGERWWPVFFGQLDRLLHKGGAAALQVITIDERRFEDYRKHPDFTQRYIFPGGMLPSPERLTAVAGERGLRLEEPLFFGHSYARTLGEWSTRFEDALADVTALGFDERFVRMWRYYLAYCRAGFSAGTIDVMQVRLET